MLFSGVLALLQNGGAGGLLTGKAFRQDEVCILGIMECRARCPVLLYYWYYYDYGVLISRSSLSPRFVSFRLLAEERGGGFETLQCFGAKCRIRGHLYHPHPHLHLPAHMFHHFLFND